jgi:hypothetical protein
VLAPHPSGIRRYLLLTRPLVCLELENVRGDRHMRFAQFGHAGDMRGEESFHDFMRLGIL